MPQIDHLDPIVHALEHYQIPEEKRPYLGISGLGGICNREKWYTFRWAYTFFKTPKLHRLFNRGHREEPVVKAELERAGIKTFHMVPEQVEVVGVMGHLKGHPDGELENVPGAEKTRHLAEIKTANNKKFVEFSKFGVKDSNEQYWCQGQMYCHYRELKRGLFIITNKDNDDRYYERFKYDRVYCEEQEDKALDILISPVPPQRISERPEWYECRYCNAYNVCHNGARPDRNCRTCTNARIQDNGEWHCAVWPGKPIPEEFQRTGCADHYKPCI